MKTFYEYRSQTVYFILCILRQYIFYIDVYMNTIFLLTHNDLDALGCVLAQEYKVPADRYFYTNYADLAERVDSILAELDSDTCLFISDVSFSENPALLDKLYQKAGKIVYTDHHMYAPDFFSRYPNMKVNYTKEICASLILGKVFEIDKNCPELYALLEKINRYDTWVTTGNFGEVQDLNEYFWNFTGDTRDRIKILADIIREIGYKMPGDYDKVVNAVHLETAKNIAEIEANNLIHRFGKTTVLLTWKSFNRIMIDEMNNGQTCVLGVQNGIIKVRFKVGSFNEQFKRDIREYLVGNPEYGHMDAFTYKIKDSSDIGIMAEIKKVIACIENFNKSI